MSSPTSDPTPTPPKTPHPANCHCGAIKYTVFLPRPLSTQTQTIYNCNCSICVKNGYLNIHLPRSDVVFSAGEHLAKGYAFGGKKWVHRFCPNCGSSLFIDPAEGEAEEQVKGLRVVNVRMFKDIDVDKLNLLKFDGAAKLEPRYEV